jgi:hypothetical protein
MGLDQQRAEGRCEGKGESMESGPMEQMSFERAVLTALREVSEKQRPAILHILQTLVRELKRAEPANGGKQYSVGRHEEIRRLTATIRGSMAAVTSAERDERG